MAKDIDRNEPLKLVPISIYNDMCTWIEKNIGSANIRKAGEKIGNRAYEQIIKNEDLPKEPPFVDTTFTQEEWTELERLLE